MDFYRFNFSIAETGVASEVKAALAACPSPNPKGSPCPKGRSKTREDASLPHTLIMIDPQSQMAFATKSIDLVLLRNNAALVAKAAKGH